jgi:hypothetical protein
MAFSKKQVRILALTDRDQGMSRFLALALNEAGAQVVLAGPGSPRIGELQLSPQSNLYKVLRSGTWGNVDAVLILECGGRVICPGDLAFLPFPTLFYGVDTHLRYREHLAVARLCDCACIVQKAYISSFRNNGVPAEWLPLAADPSVHRPVAGVPTHQIVFVGNIIPKLHTERAKLLERLRRRYSVMITRASFCEVAHALSLGLIAFNRSMAGELNLRVFETLACGRCLITDRAPGSGLEELFTNGVHLHVYDDDNLEEVVDRLLDDPEIVYRTAQLGREEVLANHTWAHRAEQLRELLAGLQVTQRSYLTRTVQTYSYLSWRRGHDFIAKRFLRASA